MKTSAKKTKKVNWSKMVLRAILICHLVFMVFSVPMTVYADEDDNKAFEVAEDSAGELGKTKLVTGTVELLDDATNVILIIEAVAVVVLCAIKFVGLQQADEQEKPKYKKEIKSIIITGIIAMCISGVLKAVFKYYT